LRAGHSGQENQHEKAKRGTALQRRVRPSQFAVREKLCSACCRKRLGYETPRIRFYPKVPENLHHGERGKKKV